MGLFDKKVCSVCGGDAGRIFTKKLEDGVLCKECTGKLSPWFSDRRSSTVEEIQAQLEYREANQAKVDEFTLTRTINGRYKLYIDEDARRFCVNNSKNWNDGNPDILDFAAVTGCSYEVKESKRDVTPEPKEDPRTGMTPVIRPCDRVYEYDYDFYITINVNNPYFNEISYQVNTGDIKSLNGGEYLNCLAQCEEIKGILSGIREEGRAAAAPKAAQVCPTCGATTTPDAAGCCEYCGVAL